MKKQTKILITLWTTLLMSGTHCLGQAPALEPTFGTRAIAFACGWGDYSLADNYISDEKYTGRMPCFTVGWASQHPKVLYRFDLEYRNSKAINNHHVSSNITQFTLNQGFLYPLHERKLFHRSLNLFLGPTAELFFFYNDPNIAVAGFDYAQSYAFLFSMGIDITGRVRLGPKSIVETSVRLSGLSLCFRMVDSEEDSQSPAKLLTPLSGLNSSLNIGLRQHLLDHLSLKAGYSFELFRISTWDPLISASDNLVIELSFHF